jgi:hypothetical protein
MVGKRDGQGWIGRIGQEKGKEGTTNHAQWHVLASCPFAVATICTDA